MSDNTAIVIVFALIVIGMSVANITAAIRSGANCAVEEAQP